MIAQAWSLPVSDLFDIKETLHSSRAVFAKTKLIAGTELLRTTLAQSPLVHIILKPYRRETCGFCFAYDRGREWKIRDLAIGLSFCSEQCKSRWHLQTPSIIIDAYKSVENHSKKSKRSQETHASHHQSIPEQRVSDAWKDAAVAGKQIAQARIREKQSKQDRRAIRQALELTPDVDTLGYLLSGVGAVYRATITSSYLEHPSEALDKARPPILPSLLQLAPDPAVYDPDPSGHSCLNDYIHAYQLLLAILPQPLLPYLSADLCHELASRASNNAFSIRPEGTTDGEQSGEFLGWGVWPEASFFNHSCRPNVKKERRGRQWIFSVAERQDIQAGDELCITYLGGDEEDLDVLGRRKRLREQWGFSCCCLRCREESESTATRPA